MDTTKLSISPQFRRSLAFETLLTRAQEREKPVQRTVLPLVRWLYDTGRWIVERGDTPTSDASEEDRLGFELAAALFTDLREPPVFEHGRDPEALREIYYEIEARMLAEDCGSNQVGYGNLLSSLRYAVIEKEAGHKGVTPRDVLFKACGVGYRSIPLVARFGKPSAEDCYLHFAEQPDRPFGRMAVAALTDNPTPRQIAEVLGRLHRFGRYGQGIETYGNWFSADGSGRELLSAMLDGLVNRVMPDQPSGLGGTSPQFALTAKGVEFVLSRPDLSSMFDGYNEIEKCTAFLVEGDERVPFDTRTGAILGRISVPSGEVPAYIMRASRTGLEPGSEYRLDRLNYLLACNVDFVRKDLILHEEGGANADDVVERAERDEVSVGGGGASIRSPGL